MSSQRSCPVCGSTRTEIFLRRPGVPVHQHLLFDNEGAARGIGRGDLDMAVCRQCGFIYNAAFDETRLSYGQQYDNNQVCSPAFSDYVDDLVDYLISEQKVVNSRIVEVGCGKGYFLKRLVEAPGAKNVGFGFDPTYIGPLVDLGGRLRFEQRFYDREARHVAPDVVICRHVIEHVAEPVALLTRVRAALTDSPQARVFFETPCVEWILQNQVIWDFFYEHCSLFSAASLATAFQQAGFQVRQVRHIFGDQYLWIEAVPTPDPPRPVSDPGRVPELAETFASRERELVEGWRQRIRGLAEEGPVAIWGAGAKGVTFAGLIDPERTLIDCVVDLNPSKQGHFLPATGHPIIHYRELESRQVAHAILMNPNYLQENIQLLRESRQAVNLVV